MDLITLFQGIPEVSRAAIADLKAGKSASEVASTHIAPNLKAIEKNAGQEMNPTYVAYLLEYVVTNSTHGKNPVHS